MSRVRAAPLLALAVALLLTACLAQDDSSAAPSPAPEPPDPLTEPESQAATPQTLRWAIGPPREIVPPLAADTDSLTVVDALFESLTRVDEDGEVRPAAASNWWANGDATAWVFVLESGNVYHDGRPVVAADVKFAWEEGIRRGVVAPHLEDVVGYDALRRGDTDKLVGVSAHGDRTLRITLERPRADLPVVMAHPSLAPVPAERWADDVEGYRQWPVGNGPFAMSEEWTRADFVRLNRVETASETDSGTVEELLFRFTDPTTGFVAFQQGRMDATTVPPGALPEALATYGAMGENEDGGVLTGERASLYLLAMNVESPPFDDPVVRRALSFALDRDDLVESVPDRNATVARGLAPASVPDGQVTSCTTCMHGAAASERMFADRGITQLEMWVNAEGGHEEVAERIAAALEEVGVHLTVHSLPFAEFVDAVESGEATLFRYGWAAEHVSLDDMLVPLLHSRSGGLESGNPGGYANEQVDALLDEAQGTRDRDERAQLFQAAKTLALGREQAVIPIHFDRHRLVVSDRVEGFSVGPTGRVAFDELRISEPLADAEVLSSGR